MVVYVLDTEALPAQNSKSQCYGKSNENGNSVNILVQTAQILWNTEVFDAVWAIGLAGIRVFSKISLIGLSFAFQMSKEFRHCLRTSCSPFLFVVSVFSLLIYTHATSTQKI